MPVFSRHWLPPGQQAVAWANPIRLRADGPVLQVTISIPSALAAQLQQSQTPLPNPHTGLGLIDTGASFTTVDDGVFQALGLSPTGTMSVKTPSGTAQQPSYDCEISFPGTPLPTLPGQGVAGSQLAGMGYSALIGRDLLSFCQLVYNGVEGIWTLAF